MGSFEIPLWIKVLGVFLAVAAIFLLAAWNIIVDWISDGLKGMLKKGSRSEGLGAEGGSKPAVSDRGTLPRRSLRVRQKED